MNKKQISKAQDNYKIEALMSKLNNINKNNKSVEMYTIKGRTIYKGDSKVETFNNNAVEVIEVIESIIESCKEIYVDDTIVPKVEKVTVQKLRSGVGNITKKCDVKPLPIKEPTIRIRFIDTEGEVL